MLWYSLGRPVITSEIGNWSVLVLFIWRFVFGIIMNWDGREPRIVRCNHGSGGIDKAVSLLRLVEGQRNWLTPRSSLTGRPARGYYVSPPCHLTQVRSWNVYVKRFTDRHAWSTCSRLVQYKNGKYDLVRTYVFTTETRGDYFCTFWWPAVGGDTFSPLAPILGPV